MGPRQARQEGERLGALGAADSNSARGAADSNGARWDNRGNGDVLNMYYDNRGSLNVKRKPAWPTQPDVSTSDLPDHSTNGPLDLLLRAPLHE